jgi:CheY-like chemotaxis protein
VRLPVVLLAEDNPDLLQAWRELLEFTGYPVHAFDSAAALLAVPELIAQADVLLTDTTWAIWTRSS